MANERYSRLDNQAPVQTEVENTDLKTSRSAFDFSMVNSGNAIMGAVIPVDCFDVVPNEDITMSIDGLLDLRNPLVRPLLNGMRVYFHSYYNRLVDLWEGAKNFLDTGLSGKLSLQRPNLIYHLEKASTSLDACTPMSLLDFLGCNKAKMHLNGGFFDPIWSFRCSFSVYNLQQSALLSNQTNLVEGYPDFFPADCAFAYQRNWRDFYANRNLLQGNKYWFPDNEDHFILSYSCQNAIALKYEDEDFAAAGSNQALYQGANLFSDMIGLDSTNGYTVGSVSDINAIMNITPEPNNPRSSATGTGWQWIYAPNLSGLKFRQFRGDRYTASLPFPDLIRGDIPVLGDFSDADYVDWVSGTNTYPIDGASDQATSFYMFMSGTGSGGDKSIRVASSSGVNQPSSLSSSDFGLSVRSSITLNDIRALETMTVFRERMARLPNKDAYYNEVIEAQFGYNPHIHSRTATYIGGFFMDFAFGQVVQTSESANTPLGQRAGSGSASGSGFIGQFHVPDFGWIQTYMSIVPDVMYTQGLPRMFSKKSQLDMYFPIFNNLAPQAILNKELFVSGTPSVDNDVFAYEDRYAEYKSRTNRVTGFMSLAHSLAVYDSARIMARRFVATPTLSHDFVVMTIENQDMDVFSVVDEPPFDYSLGIKVRRVFPGPYTAVPGALSSSLHA